MKPYKQWRQVSSALLDLIFPPRCIGCGHFGSFLCAACRTTLPRLSPPYCPKCGRPTDKPRLCPICVGSPLEIDGIRSPFIFTGTVREAIHKLKYDGLTAISSPLAQLLLAHFQQQALEVDIIVPVPLHKKRLRERGYNQSALLAKELGQSLGLPMLERTLVRLRNTPPQAGMASVEERRRNVDGAFNCQGNLVEGCRVLLLDDVCTTGATLEACSIALKRAGAKSVWGLTVAR